MRASVWVAVCALGAAAGVLASAGAGREQMAFADEAIGRMKESSRSLRAMLGASRTTKDAVRASCLNDKLTQLEVVERQAEDARAALRRASLREDQDAI